MLPSQSGLNELIIAVCRAHRARTTTLLAERGLHPGQEQLLFVLWNEGPQTQSTLADRLGVQAPTINKMVSRMESSGLLERRTDPTDGRSLRIAPTEQAHGLRADIEGLWRDLAEVSGAGLDEAQLGALRELLGTVARNLNAVASATCS
ncbi:MarR family winged helix-turn-helix transcriptional regulator [Deinococcus yavapaiensis]|uniref:DNA-binding MarR family transcriptional regulator n=1 Tax=Deinococcus yavapaiensis KR-236 TaxID=694435 RepID=A0A318S0U7_9DEIO|nr:MarR family winged helix-turn-helix transcriptional regulator [Deinococcus yavapaiensis]PYE50516.1 DNA-binding MarR family transcriptional regulator [Deinococcus yavapaiensis KR-236]